MGQSVDRLGRSVLPAFSVVLLATRAVCSFARALPGFLCFYFDEHCWILSRLFDDHCFFFFCITTNETCKLLKERMASVFLACRLTCLPLFAVIEPRRWVGSFKHAFRSADVLTPRTWYVRISFSSCSFFPPQSPRPLPLFCFVLFVVIACHEACLVRNIPGGGEGVYSFRRFYLPSAIGLLGWPVSSKP